MGTSSVWDIRRNDIPACVALYEARGVTPDEARVMIRLQDDPSEIMGLIKTWKITMPPAG